MNNNIQKISNNMINMNNMPIQNMPFNNSISNQNNNINMINIKNENIIRAQEGGYGHKPIPLETTDKVRKALCKIIQTKNNKPYFGTGFFMLYDGVKYLLTCHHVIDSKELDIIIQLWNKNEFKLYLLNRDIIFLPKPIDITIIKIEESDEFIMNNRNDILFLNCDLNYINGYQDYEGIDIFNIGYPDGGQLSCASGIVKKIKDNEFYHDIDTKPGSSGSPIILFNTKRFFA